MNDQSIDIASLRIFFDSYRSLESQFWLPRFEVDKENFNRLKVAYHSHKPRLDDLREKDSPYYNIFKILRIRHYEEKVHTPFIAHLIDPNESHEQGALFRDHFFQQVLQIDPSVIDPKSFYVQVEVAVNPESRIDILIEYYVEGKRKAIVIENKIYAGDQKDQLYRYYEYVTGTGLDKSDFILAYLNLNGTPPSSNSVRKFSEVQDFSTSDIRMLGYRQHIIPWLDEVYPKIKSNLVKDMIYQYIRTIQSL